MLTKADNAHLYSSSLSIAEIDAEIRNLEDRLLQLRTMRNKLTPISNLPTEILTKVFGFVLLDTVNGVTVTRNVLTVTWVSQRWREVAIGCPRLWRYIDQSNLRWAQECLERCGDANLMVSVSLMNMLDEIALNRLLDEAFHRVSSLALLPFDQDTRWAQSLPFDLGKPAPPHLESLTLGMFGIGDDIFVGNVPQLRRLALAGTFFATSTLHKFTGLTHLTIKSPVEDLILPHLLAVLSLTPQLEHLFLDHLYGLTSGLINPTKPTPRLRNLVSLRLVEGGDYEGIKRLLQHIDTPESTSIHIQLVVGKITTTSLITLFALASSQPIHALAINFRLPLRIAFQFYSSEEWDTSLGCITVEVVQEPSGIATATWVGGWMHALNTIAFDSLKTIYLDSELEIPSSIWETVFSSWHGTTEVRVQNIFAKSLLEHITRTYVSSGHQPRNANASQRNLKVAFPSLQKLILGLGAWYPEVSSNHLRDAIAARRSLGLKEVVVQEEAGEWDPILDEIVDIVVDPLGPPYGSELAFYDPFD